jgi:hypothetical protein
MANEVKVVVNADTSKARDKLQNFKKSAQKVGLALTAMGAAGTLAIKGFVGAALEQERAMKTLAASVENTGVSFDSVKGRIERTTAALQKKTNFGDEQQMRALQIMVPILGDVDKAMAALPAVLDASSASGKSLETVSNTLTRALSGSVNTATSVGMVFDKDATFAERLALVLGGVGGAAEANADPMIQMNMALGDMKEKIGDALIPVVVPLVEKITALAETVQKVNPSILKWGALILAAVTAIGLIIGPLLLLSSALAGPLVAAIGAVKVAIMALGGATGIGLILLLLGTLFVAWQTNFGGIREITATVVNFLKEKFIWFFGNVAGWIDKLIGGFNKLFGTSIPPIGEMFDTVKDKATEAIDKVKEFVFPKQVRTDLIASGIHIDQNKQKMKEFKEETDKTTESTKKLHDETKNLMKLVAGGFKESGVGDLFDQTTKLGLAIQTMHAFRDPNKAIAALNQQSDIAGTQQSELGRQSMLELADYLTKETSMTPDQVKALNLDVHVSVGIDGTRLNDAQGTVTNQHHEWSNE